MNAERLHVVALTLTRELAERKVTDRLQALVNACQALGQQSNVSTQQNLVTARDNFYAAVTNTPSDSFTPAWRQILLEIGGEELFGNNLKVKVQEIFAANQMTPLVAYQQLKELSTQLEAFENALDQLVTAFAHFHIGSEELAPGEAEIALLIPRAEVDDKLDEFADELKKMKFILNTFSEVATGHPDGLKIRTVSSSGLLIFLSASPVFGAIVARVVNFIVGQYKQILEIRKLQLEIERLQLPEEISEKTREHANTQMEREIVKFTAELVKECPIDSDRGRKNELENSIKISLEMIANRIDRGFNFEVRIQPPKVAKDLEADTEIKQAIQTIQGASINMQYMKLEGPRSSHYRSEPNLSHRATSRKREKLHTKNSSRQTGWVRYAQEPYPFGQF
jgi:hypothetical protein